MIFKISKANWIFEEKKGLSVSPKTKKELNKKHRYTRNFSHFSLFQRKKQNEVNKQKN